MKTREFSLELKAWRAARGMTQLQASTSLEVPLDVYRTWEQATRRPAKYVEPMIREKMERVSQ